jgi:hypothetical protein
VQRLEDRLILLFEALQSPVKMIEVREDFPEPLIVLGKPGLNAIEAMVMASNRRSISSNFRSRKSMSYWYSSLVMRSLSLLLARSTLNHARGSRHSAASARSGNRRNRETEPRRTKSLVRPVPVQIRNLIFEIVPIPAGPDGSLGRRPHSALRIPHSLGTFVLSCFRTPFVLHLCSVTIWSRETPSRSSS